MAKTEIHPVEVTVGGVKHTGQYWVDRKILTVSSEFGPKSTQVGSLPPDFLAKQLLRELVQSGAVRK